MHAQCECKIRNKIRFGLDQTFLFHSVAAQRGATRKFEMAERSFIQYLKKKLIKTKRDFSIFRIRHEIR
jgi:hypothetical protein